MTSPAASARPPARGAWPTLTKGHGTGNDFLLLSDPDAALDLTPQDVRAVTDRHVGIGADGLIRAVRGAALARTDGAVARLLADAAQAGAHAEWFMDYRNGDGSIAEMCGNGVRVFTRYLLAQGLVELPDGAVLPVGTRAGVLGVRREGEDFAVAMGRYGVPGGDAAVAAGWDATVHVAGLDGARPGLSVVMPNPHVVLAVASTEELAALDLTRAPVVEPVPERGTNVEIVHALGEAAGEAWGEPGVVGVVRMRVHERGVGETLSCGTGACAAAVAARLWAGEDAPATWIVHVPGGTVRVRLGEDGEVELVGPAQLVAEVTLR